MVKIDLKQRSSITIAFLVRSAPCRTARIDRRPGLGPGPRPGLALAVQALAGLKYGDWPGQNLGQITDFL